MRHAGPRILMPRFMAVLFAALYFGTLLLTHLFVVRFETSVGPNVRLEEMTGKLYQISMPILVFWAVLYGGFRAKGFHPAGNARYWKWLANTPWTARSPLPLGPAHLVWQDVLIIGGWMWCCAFLSHAPAAIPAIAALGAYLLVTTLHLSMTGRVAHVCALVAMFPLTWYAAPNLWLVLLVLVIGYGVVLHGLQMSWRTFPWDLHRKNDRPLKSTPEAQRLGWPFDRLNGQVPATRWSSTKIATVALLTGWYALSIVSCFVEHDRHLVWNVTIIVQSVGVAAGFFRFMVYCAPLQPPLSLWARVRLRQFVIPGYDYVLIAPLAIALTAVGGPIVLNSLHADPALVAGLMTSTLIVLLCALPPTLKHWQLTGHGRMTVMTARGE